MESLSLAEASKLYIALLKERFHGTTAETFTKFQEILVRCVAESETMNRTMVFSEVNALFSKHHDLIDMFRDFLYYLDHNRASSVESNGEEALRLIPDKKSIQIVVDSCVEFMNRVERVLRDDDKFKLFIAVIIGFQGHGDVKRVEQEAGFLFKEHPELEIEFCEFLAEANAGRTVQEMVVSKKRKREEAIERNDRGRKRKWGDFESRMFNFEDVLYKQDLGYNLMLRAKEAAKRLMMENSGRKNLREYIRIGSYFRGLNLKFMKKELKFTGKCCKLVFKKSIRRGKAILKSEEFVCFLEKGIGVLTQHWSEDKKRLAKLNRKRDFQIPVFDWRAAQ